MERKSEEYERAACWSYFYLRGNLSAKYVSTPQYPAQPTAPTGTGGALIGALNPVDIGHPIPIILGSCCCVGYSGRLRGPCADSTGDDAGEPQGDDVGEFHTSASTESVRFFAGGEGANVLADAESSDTVAACLGEFSAMTVLFGT